MALTMDPIAWAEETGKIVGSVFAYHHRQRAITKVIKKTKIRFI